MNDERNDSFRKSETEWKSILTHQQFFIARKGGSEPPFTGEYWDSTANGMYHCVCCAQRLFDSNDKHRSGSGWPTFSISVSDHAIELFEVPDEPLKKRVACARCDAKLGYAFSEADALKSQRFCINSAALKFVARVTPHFPSLDNSVEHANGNNEGTTTESDSNQP